MATFFQVKTQVGDWRKPLGRREKVREDEIGRKRGKMKNRA